MSREDATTPPASPDELGLQAGTVIRERVEAIFADAERRARDIEQAAEQERQRAGEVALAAAREEATRERLRVLDEAKTAAAAIVNEAEEQATAVRKRAADELAHARERGVREAERSAERARARLTRFADAAERELDSLIAALRQESDGR